MTVRVFPSRHRAPSSWSRRRAITEGLVALIGIGLILLAIVLTQSWFDRHLLPSFYLMRRWYVFLESSSRVVLALAGVFLLLVARPRLGRLAADRPSPVIAAAVAAILAIGAGQLVLSWRRPSTWLLASVEPLRRPDPRLGWTFVPAREGHKTVGRRTITFAFDTAGYRAAENIATKVCSSAVFRSDTAQYSTPPDRHVTKWYPFRPRSLGADAPALDEGHA